MDDGRPGIVIWLYPGVVPPPTSAVALGLSPSGRLVYVIGRICFGSATPMCMGDHKSLEVGGALVEVGCKWNWLR